MKRTGLVLLALIAGCGAMVEAATAQEPTHFEAECTQRVPGEWWAGFAFEGVPSKRLSRAGVYLQLPPGAGQSMGIDQTLDYYRAELVVFGDGRIDVWCGDGDVVSFTAFIDLY